MHFETGPMRECPRKREDISSMGYIQGEGRGQGTLFPVVSWTILFRPIMCAASSMRLSQSLRCQSLASSVLRPRRQDDLVMIREIC